MILPTASALQRASICAASCCLPRVNSTSEAAERGTETHAYLESASKFSRDTALDAVPTEYRAICECIDLDALPVDSAKYAAEVTFAFDVLTGKAREVGRSLGRDYSGIADTEIVGTADVLGVSADSAFVCDFKTGRGKYVTRIEENLQLRFLALAACRAYGKDQAVIEIIHLKDDGTTWKEQARLDAFDLDEIALLIQRIADDVQATQQQVDRGQTPNVTQSMHCHYCPSFVFCSAQKSLVLAMGTAPSTVERDIMTLLTPENAGAAWVRLREAESVIARVRKAIYGFAALSPIPLPNGMLLGEIETTREKVDGKIAHQTLRVLYGGEVADAACSLDSSKKAIRDTMRGVAKTTGRKLAELERETLAVIREAGGIESKTSRRVDEYSPKETKVLDD